MALSQYSHIEKLLPRSIGSALTKLLEAELLHSYTIARCHLKALGDRSLVFSLELSGQRSTPFTVVVKCSRSSLASSVKRVNREVWAIEHVRSLRDESLSHAAPEIYRHDPALGIVLMEDLESSRQVTRLHDLLQSRRRDEAVAGLLSLSRTLGRLHRPTFDATGESQPQGNWLNGNEEQRALAKNFEQTVRALRKKLSVFGVKLDEDAVTELREMYAILYAGGRAFCHGDINPKNVFVSAAGTLFCDFEFAGYRHPMLDGMHLGWAFPLSIDAGSLPNDVVRELRAVYRRELDMADRIEDSKSASSLRRIEAAALIAFITHHWVHTSPEAGLPVAFAGSRSKVLDLMRMLEADNRAAELPAITDVLVQAGRRMRADGALAPDSSLRYACFQDRAARSRPRDDETGPEGTLSSDVSGIFRVNRHCHLVVKKNDSDSTSIVVSVLQHPAIHCTAFPSSDGSFQAVEMPLKLAASRQRVTIQDTRTKKTVEIKRLPAAVMALSHSKAFLQFLRYQLAGRFGVTAAVHE